MCLQYKGRLLFIGENEGGNPTSNRCGIPYFSKKQHKGTYDNRKVSITIVAKQDYIVRGHKLTCQYILGGHMSSLGFHWSTTDPRLL